MVIELGLCLDSNNEESRVSDGGVNPPPRFALIPTTREQSPCSMREIDQLLCLDSNNEESRVLCAKVCSSTLLCLDSNNEESRVDRFVGSGDAVLCLDSNNEESRVIAS